MSENNDLNRYLNNELTGDVVTEDKGSTEELPNEIKVETEEETVEGVLNYTEEPISDIEEVLVFDEEEDEEAESILGTSDEEEDEEGEEDVPDLGEPVSNANFSVITESDKPKDKWLSNFYEYYALPKKMDTKADQDAFEDEALRINQVHIPDVRYDLALKSIEKIVDKLSEEGDSEKVERLIRAIGGIVLSVDRTLVDDNVLSKPESDFRQGVVDPKTNKLLSMSPVNIRSKESDVAGAVAIMKAARALGTGDVINIPLPHSGFWVTISPPSEKSIIAFYNNLHSDNTRLGRLSYGYTFGNMSSKLNADIMTFFKQHIYKISLKDVAPEEIDSKILLNDMPFIVWGLARAMYPSGFLFKRICTANDSCGHIEEVNLNLDKMIAIDNNRLSVTQKEIFSQVRPRSTTLEQYRSYIDSAKYLDNSTFVFNDIVKINFKAPTIYEHLEDGMDWIDSVTDSLDKVLTSGSYTRDGEYLVLNDLIKASYMRNWAHFVNYIEIDGSRVPGEDRVSIGAVLEELGADREFFVQFEKAVIGFRNRSVIGAIGINTYKCPKCSGDNVPKENAPTVDYVIPLDASSLFFLMCTIRYQKTTNKLS